MLESASSKNQVSVNASAVLAGTSAGFAAFVFWKFSSTPDLSQSTALRLAALVFVVAAAAGFVVALLLPLGKMDKGMIVSTSAIAGLKSGLIAALVCAGLIVSASVLKTLDAPTRVADLVLRTGGERGRTGERGQCANT